MINYYNDFKSKIAPLTPESKRWEELYRIYGTNRVAAEYTYDVGTDITLVCDFSPSRISVHLWTRYQTMGDEQYSHHVVINMTEEGELETGEPLFLMNGSFSELCDEFRGGVDGVTTEALHMMNLTKENLLEIIEGTQNFIKKVISTDEIAANSAKV